MGSLTVREVVVDKITVDIGPRSATLYTSELRAGLQDLTTAGDAREFALIRGMSFSRAELQDMLAQVDRRPA